MERGSLMAGQAVGLVDEIKPVKDVIVEMVADAERELGQIGRVLGGE
ncbi:MAG: hypothetical protein ABIA59_07545 [Candidatus Latescibacterota bacterium]